MSRLWTKNCTSKLILLLIFTFSPIHAQEEAPMPPQPTPPQPMSPQNERSISVTGVGSVETPPDTATITLGVETRSSSAQEALSENSAAQSALLDVLSEAGIAETDIQTDGLSLYPVYGNRDELATDGTDVSGYSVSNTVSVRVRDLDGLGSVLEEVVAVGGNSLQGLSFSVADPAPFEVQARELAFENARAKAQQLAELSGASLGEVVSVQESLSRNAPQPYAARAADFESVPIAQGSQTISVNVEVSWRLE